MTTDTATANTNPDFLNLKVKSQVPPKVIQDGEEVFFKIKKTTVFKKLMDAYCQRQSVTDCANIVEQRQCTVPLRRRADQREPHPEGRN